MNCITLLTLAALAVTSAFDLPDNLEQIHDDHLLYLTRNLLLVWQTAKNALSDAFKGDAVYCGNIPNAIFLKGSNGNYDYMGIDCDGVNNSAGACSNDPSGQSETASKVTVQSFSINNLDVNLHLYVVFGNKGANPSFSPKQFTISMSNLCFPNDGLTGDNSHDPKDVLYTGFMGQQAIPGANGADWSAGNTANFKNSITYLGDNLVASLQA